VLVEKLSKDRKTAARARLREEPDLERWGVAARRLTSGYAADKPWADFDFLVRSGNLERIEEGKYDESGPPNRTPNSRPHETGRYADVDRQAEIAGRDLLSGGAPKGNAQ
jgi:hypothetical protein